MVDFKLERMTERIIDFMADAPFLLAITLLTISFNFLSLIFSSEAMLKVTSAFLAIVFFSFTNQLVEEKRPSPMLWT